MILVISGTNRPGSLTGNISRQYCNMIGKLTDEPTELFLLEKHPQAWLHEAMYDASDRSPALVDLQQKFFIPATKWVILSPEYNGSYPGALKVLIDALSVKDADATFRNKKVALIGLSSGRAGNWLGMDQLTTVLQYLKMNVYHSKPALRQVDGLINEKKIITDPKTLSLLESHAVDFLNY